jgi:hypothetical protein
MSGTTPEEDLCRRWYRALDARDINALMALFADDPAIFVGAGDSTGAARYTMREPIRGQRYVREYYEDRFAKSAQALAQGNTAPASQPPTRSIRPFCAFQHQPCIFLPWIVFNGEIRDHDDHGGYEGPFLHVFRIVGMKIASLEMFLDPTCGKAQP